MKKLGMFLLILLLCISLSGCSELAKLVSDMNSEDNPLSGKNTDERIIMCLEEEYPEHDFVVVESFMLALVEQLVVAILSVVLEPAAHASCGCVQSTH